MRQEIVNATIASLLSISVRRFFKSERGYQGIFYCKLYDELEKYGLVNEDQIVEMEYQKSSRHSISQRPDIIYHIPIEHSGANVDENNFAVWALKASASLTSAEADFYKLEEMFDRLKYPIGFFININSNLHHLELYNGSFKDRLFAFSVWLQDDKIRLTQASFDGDDIKEQKLS